MCDGESFPEGFPLIFPPDSSEESFCAAALAVVFLKYKIWKSQILLNPLATEWMLLAAKKKNPLISLDIFIRVHGWPGALSMGSTN